MIIEKNNDLIGWGSVAWALNSAQPFLSYLTAFLFGEFFFFCFNIWDKLFHAQSVSIELTTVEGPGKGPLISRPKKGFLRLPPQPPFISGPGWPPPPPQSEGLDLPLNYTKLLWSSFQQLGPRMLLALFLLAKKSEAKTVLAQLLEEKVSSVIAQAACK